MLTLQEIIQKLSAYWSANGCALHQAYDLEVGAATFNPTTFYRCLGPEPYNAAYAEPCRRPSDGRYGENPNRMQHFHQYQVIMKPIPDNFQELFIGSLEAIGIDLSQHDLRFVHDDWENPTIGAHGLGWEVWLDGMEVTQYTYFQGVGGLHLETPSGELAYGIERLATYIQNVDSIYDVMWNENLTVGDIFRQNEVEWSTYNFEKANCDMWLRHFNDFEQEANQMMDLKLPIPAFDFVMKASHAFNNLDARGAISVTERTGYITRIRNLAKRVAQSYTESRAEKKHPLLGKFQEESNKDVAAAAPLTNFIEGKKEHFIFEIGSEQLPTSYVPTGAKNLEKAMAQLLKNEGLAHGNIQLFSTPRRLAVLVEDLAHGKSDEYTEKKGPSLDFAFDASGSPSKAGYGFLRSIGVDSCTQEEVVNGKIENLEVREIGGKEHLFCKLHIPGKSTQAILAGALPKLIQDLTFPKKMHWRDTAITYPRPIRWIVAMHGETVIPFMFGKTLSGNTTYGHAQISPEPIKLETASNYASMLETRHVIADSIKRKREIEKQLDDICQNHSVAVVERERVMRQVLNLCEKPKLMVCDFSDKFLEAPKEVLISEMVEHQKYFPLCNHDETLVNKFIVTADNTPSDLIQKGNEKVLSARLADGVFLYKQDLENPLESYNEKLKIMTFQKELGTVWDKVVRIGKHADVIGKKCNLSKPETISRAATLCKSDLATALVGEFPDLQGTVGSYYAKEEDGDIADAIKEHWLPTAEGGELPKSQTGVVLSLADKVDNLLGYFAAGLKPTSSSDPYALRRQTIGIVRIMLENSLSFDFEEMLQACAKNFPEAINSSAQIEEIMQFFTTRAKTVFVDYGFTKEEIESALAKGCNNPSAALQKLRTIFEYREKESVAFANLREVYKRAHGQLKQRARQNIDPSLIREEAEIALFEALQKIDAPFKAALEKEDYASPLQMLSELQPKMAKLFNEVKIQDDDEKIRENRLALLSTVLGYFDSILNFNRLV